MVVGAEKEKSLWTIGSDSYISGILRALLKKLAPGTRIDVLGSAVSKGAATSTIVDVVFDLGREHGKYGRDPVLRNSRRLLTAAQLRLIEHVAVKCIRQAASDGTLSDAPALGSVLYRWRDWGNQIEPREWCASFTLSDAGLLRVLEAFQGRSDGTDGTRFHLDPASNPLSIRRAVISRCRDWRDGPTSQRCRKWPCGALSRDSSDEVRAWTPSRMMTSSLPRCGKAGAQRRGERNAARGMRRRNAPAVVNVRNGPHPSPLPEGEGVGAGLVGTWRRWAGEGLGRSPPCAAPQGSG